MNPLAQRILSTFNFWEGIAWIVIAVGLVCYSLVRGRPDAVVAWIAAVGLFAFGCSDFVEMRTGAWWRPWWLLTWKSACVVYLIGTYLWYRRRSL